MRYQTDRYILYWQTAVVGISARGFAAHSVAIRPLFKHCKRHDGIFQEKSGAPGVIFCFKNV